MRFPKWADVPVKLDALPLDVLRRHITAESKAAWASMRRAGYANANTRNGTSYGREGSGGFSAGRGRTVTRA